VPLKLKWIGGVAHAHGTVAGRRIRQSLRTRDPEIAEHLRAKAEARLLKASLYGEEYEIAFAEAALKYLSEGGEGRFLKPILTAFGPARRVCTIKPGHVRSLARQLYPDAGPATWNRQVITPVRAVINHAADSGLCAPIRIRRFPEPRKTVKAGDSTWVEAYCAAEPDPRLRAARRFMYQTGARISDCVAVEPRHLDLDNRRITLPRTKNGEPGVFLLSTALAAEIAALPPRRCRDGSLRVFGFQSRDGLHKAFRRTCERAGIEYLTSHEAGRHAFATEMIVRRGVDVASAAELGRWKSRRLLMERYAHPEDLPGLVEAAFGGAGKPVAGLRAPKLQAVDLSGKKQR